MGRGGGSGGKVGKARIYKKDGDRDTDGENGGKEKER